jgi:UDP-N-acetylmuramoylalanine-D-glutamate ligase
MAYKMASAGEAVIFSPSCSPNDAYRNFADRGVAFKKYTEELK